MSQSFPPSSGSTHDPAGPGVPPQGAYPPPVQTGYPVPVAAPTNGPATASMVVGIVSLFASLLFLPAVIGLILGIVGLQRSGSTTPPVGRGKAVAGIVMSVASFGFGALWIAIIAASAGGDVGAADATSTSISQDGTTTEEAAPDKPAAEPADKPEPAEPAMTVSQEQAVGSAQNYIDLTPFSRSGLVDQLVYEDFSRADAEFAVDQLDVDWKEQAARSAKNYLDLTSFSRQGLIDQLVYEGFTTEQATYGVDRTGL
ncbi:Ltp family lipoprotein [Myceligenerans crystallogenes]|uniref:Host cell surface-exposed lipoprotein n=1 Tax=Myceligenerans crystallogenes TaxID=316335 RepID=A0ABN2NIP6_9MICO